MTLIAEDVLLLLLDDAKGTVSPWLNTDIVLGGAVLAELDLLGLATVGEKTSRWRSGRVHATGPAPADLDPVLADALATIAEKDRTAVNLVARIGKGLDHRLAAGLAERRILERREDKRLGLIPRTTWPVADPTRDHQLRRAITVCLADGGRPDERTAAIIGLLWAADEAHKAVAANTATPRKQLKKRAKEIAEGQWAAKAVKDAIAAAASSGG
jgi:Golgi phosphoprotein 3 GPP34